MAVASLQASASAPQTPQQSAMVRAQILANALPVLQPVKTGTMTYAYGNPTTVNTLAQPVGFIRRFYLEITGVINAASTHVLTATPGGLANLLSNIQFTDQNNRQRIYTTGWHMLLSSTVRRRRPFGEPLTAAALPNIVGMGSNFPVQGTSQPATVTGTSGKTFTVVFEIPVTNSNVDLTGGLLANQITSNNVLNFTLNPNFFTYNVDAFNAGYYADAALGTSLPTLTSLSWTLYQDYLDDLPQDKNGFAVVPEQDTAYSLNFMYPNLGVQVANSDNQYSLPAFNAYQNLMLFWDNYTYNTTVGGDITYIKVQIANSYVLRQWDSLLLQIQMRDMIGTDMPAFINSGVPGSGAVYNLPFYNKPLMVNQLSSTNIIFRPSTVESGASLNMGQEFLLLANNG
jgi:hypothetical protein